MGGQIIGMKARAPWWENHSLHIVLILACLIPLLFPTVPPLIDLPGHMGRYKVELNYDSVPALQHYYRFQWQMIGNLGVDLLIIPMAKLFGLELGTKLIVMAVVALTASGLLWIAREVHGKVTPTAFFALPLVYSHPFMFGFINYCFAMALALNAFALWLRLERMQLYRARVIVFLFIAPIIWLAHAFGWGVLCLLCGSAELIHQHDRRGDWFSAAWHTGVNCLVLVPPLLLMIVWRTGDHVGGQTGDWFNMPGKLLWIEMTLRDRWMSFDIASLFILVGVIVAAIVMRRLSYSRNLALTGLILLAAFIGLPRIVFGSAYADMRMIPYVIAIGIVGIRMRPQAGFQLRETLAVLGLLFFGVRLVGTTWSFAQSAQVYNQALGALDHVPEGARLVSFVGHPCRTPWITNRLEHVPALAIVRRNAFSNDQWEMAGAQLMHTNYPLDGFPAKHYSADSSEIVVPGVCRGEYWWSIDDSLFNIPRDKFDYVWLLDPPPFHHSLLHGMTRIWLDGNNALYRIDRPANPLRMDTRH